MENQENKKIGRLVSQSELGLSAFAGKNISIPKFNCVHVKSNYSEATNGSFFCRVEKDTMDPEEFPRIENTGHGFEFEQHIDICIPLDTLKGVKVPKKIHLPILGYANLTTNENQHYLTSTDLKTTQITPFTKENITYPDIEQVIPHYDNPIRIGISAEFLGTICDYVSRFGNQRTKGMVLTIPRDFENDGGKPIEFEAKLESGQMAKGLIMPMRI